MRNCFCQIKSIDVKRVFIIAYIIIILILLIVKQISIFISNNSFMIINSFKVRNVEIHNICDDSQNAAKSETDQPYERRTAIKLVDLTYLFQEITYIRVYLFPPGHYLFSPSVRRWYSAVSRRQPFGSAFLFIFHGLSSNKGIWPGVRQSCRPNDKSNTDNSSGVLLFR